MADRDIEFVLFDLGGVLIELGGIIWFQQLTGLGHEDDVWARWLACPWVRRFETGGCSPDEFAEGLVAEWQLDVSPDAFLTSFEAWPIGPFPGAAELLADVGDAVPIGCCSNTNVVHWAYQSREWPMLDLFDHRFLSFELGLVKPDGVMFDAVAGAVSLERDRILFLDDLGLNVDAARRSGFRAERVRGPDECRTALVRHGVL